MCAGCYISRSLDEQKLEAKQISVDIAKKGAKIEIERAGGIAEANTIINESLTAQYLQHEINMALQSFAENDGQHAGLRCNSGYTASADPVE